MSEKTFPMCLIKACLSVIKLSEFVDDPGRSLDAATRWSLREDKHRAKTASAKITKFAYTIYKLSTNQ